MTGAAPHTADGGRYGQDIGRLIDDYKDFTIMGALGGSGYRARMRAAGRRGHVGGELPALTLDELADAMDEARAARAAGTEARR